METKKLLQHAMQQIRHYRKENRWSQGHLAELCGWENPARVSNYENLSREPTLDDLAKMANAIRIPLKNILFEDSSQDLSNTVELPVLLMDEIEAWINGNLPTVSRTLRMRISDIDISKKHKYFSVIIDDDSMETPSNLKKSICDSDIVTVDMFSKPEKKDIVAALVRGQAVIREYAKDGSKFFLKALNSTYPPIEINENVEILGVVIKKEVDYKNCLL
jgi:SOS-response transcriptional repressor LexA